MRCPRYFAAPTWSIIPRPDRKDTTIKGQIVLLGFCLVAAAACTTLPRAGPYRSDLVADQDGAPRPFGTVEITPPVIDTLEKFRSPSFAGTFGAYHPPRLQRIGVGDTLQVTLWEAGPGGLFSAPTVDGVSPGSRSATIPNQVVGSDGTITVPFAGRIAVVGRTPPDVEAVIVGRLQGKAIDPQALVTVTSNVSSSVTVMGEVGSGKRIPLSVAGERLLDVVAEAGGMRDAAYDIDVVLARHNSVVRVPLQAVLEDPREDVFMQPADVVTLVKNPHTFTAAGATGRNAVVPFETRNLSLEEALGKAGGVLDDRGDPDGVFVIRYEPESVARAMPDIRWTGTPKGPAPIVYHLSMRDPNAFFMARRFVMRDKDILYVSNAPLSDLQKVFSLINLLVSPVISGAYVDTVVK